ncbi:MAG TPA: SPFH domain-containing protein, partial [Pirellulales bacterium]|nr:SPFH domain-containing protein [Pirellulales bacterium]
MHFLGLPHAHDSDVSPRRFWPRVACLAVLLLVAWLASRAVFFVDETEYVYVTQFGEPLKLYTEAGLGLKWPYQSLWRFDRRLQLYEPPAREMLTQDKENLNFEWYVCWRIARPSVSLPTADATTSGENTDGQDTERQDTVRRFLQSVGGIQAAESRLEERIQAALAAEVGRTRLAQLVSL